MNPDSLYKLNLNHLEALEKLEALADSDQDASKIFEEFEKSEEDIHKKLEKYCYAKMKLENDIEAIKKEKQRLDRLLKSKTNAKTSLLQRMEYTLNCVLNLRKLVVGTFKIGYRGCKKSVFVPDISRVPENFVKTEVSFNANAIYDYLKTLPEGEDCPWAKLTGGETFSIT